MTFANLLLARAAALAIATSLALPGVSAWADGDGARCVVRVIHAVDPNAGANAAPAAADQPKAAAKAAPESGVKIDPRIDRLRPNLLKPPFTAWREFVLLDKRTLDLQPKVPQQVPLPNGKIASLTFLEHLPAIDGKHHRVRMQLQIDGPRKLDTVFVVHEGGVVLQAGQHYQGGLLVLGTSCDQAHDQKP